MRTDWRCLDFRAVSADVCDRCAGELLYMYFVISQVESQSRGTSSRTDGQSCESQMTTAPFIHG